MPDGASLALRLWIEVASKTVSSVEEIWRKHGTGYKPYNRYGVGNFIFQAMYGPVEDRDGYNDGTCNYYIFVQLYSDRVVAERESRKLYPNYAVLYCDEQTAASGRWRMVDPRDSTMFSDPNKQKHDILTEALNFISTKLVNDARRVEEGEKSAFPRSSKDSRPRFNPEHFFSPFDRGLVNGESRMKTSQQIVGVTGRYWKGIRDAIYTINYTHSTMDKTWRVRTFEGQHGQTKKRMVAVSDVRDLSKGGWMPHIRIQVNQEGSLQDFLIRGDSWGKRLLNVRAYSSILESTRTWTVGLNATHFAN